MSSSCEIRRGTRESVDQYTEWYSLADSGVETGAHRDPVDAAGGAVVTIPAL
jgi:hypothetical protein